MPGGYSGLFKNTKGAKEHEKNIELMESVIRDFGHLLIERSQHGLIYADDIPDYVQEMIERIG